jgi:hypothetical protein
VNYISVTFSKQDFEIPDSWQSCDRKMQHALTGATHGVAVFLASTMDSNTSLMDWIEKWQKKFSKESKRLFFIAETAEQFEFLECSHPDLNLVYFAAKEELAEAVPDFFSQSASPVDETGLAQRPLPMIEPINPSPLPVQDNKPNESFTIEELLSAPSSQQNEIAPAQKPVVSQRRIPSQPEFQRPGWWQPPEAPIHINPLPIIDEPIIKIGAIVEIAGEYVCCSCNAKRMYIKGGRATACENPECQETRAGLRLTFDLF